MYVYTYIITKKALKLLNNFVGISVDRTTFLGSNILIFFAYFIYSWK